MYPVAHIVVASGAAWTTERVTHRLFRHRKTATAIETSGQSPPFGFDYRFVALGALLPDIIDKPLAWWFLKGSVEDDHLFAHTLVFALALGVPGIYFARRGNSALLSLAFGVFIHLLCDPVLREPRTMFWPLSGWKFHDTFGKGNGLPVNLALDLVLGSIGLFVLWRQWRTGRIRDLVWQGEVRTETAP